jgi:hypothetical protein
MGKKNTIGQLVDGLFDLAIVFASIYTVITDICVEVADEHLLKGRLMKGAELRVDFMLNILQELWETVGTTIYENDDRWDLVLLDVPTIRELTLNYNLFIEVNREAMEIYIQYAFGKGEPIDQCEIPITEKQLKRLIELIDKLPNRRQI